MCVYVCVHVCVRACGGMCVCACVWGQRGSWSAVPSDGLGQPHAVVGPVKDAVILPDEDIPQDPLLGIIFTLEATGAEALVLGKGRPT